MLVTHIIRMQKGHGAGSAMALLVFNLNDIF